MPRQPPQHRGGQSLPDESVVIARRRAAAAGGAALVMQIEAGVLQIVRSLTD